MSALQWDLRDQQDLFLATVIAEEDAAVVDKRALFHFSCPAEPEDLCAGTGCQLDAGQVIGVEHGTIFGSLVFEDARLCIGISGERAMPVEMVGRDIENQSNLRTKCLNGFELKTGDLQDKDGLSSCPVDQ